MDWFWLREPAVSPSNVDQARWLVQFTEAVVLDATDFVLTGTTAEVTVADAVPSFPPGKRYSVFASGGDLATVSGTIALDIAAGQNIEDTAGNAMTDITPVNFRSTSFVLDNLAPTVTVTDVPSASNAPFTATFTFSEQVTGFAADDITLGNAAGSAVTTVSATVYTQTISPGQTGAVTVDVAANGAQDAVGNGNAAAVRASSAFTRPPGSNVAPTVTAAIPDQAATTGTAFNFAFLAGAFSDANGDALSYLASSADDSALPAWLSFTAATRAFTGTPAAADVGTVAVKVTANDGHGGTVSDEFDIRVSLTDTTPPALSSSVINNAGQVIELYFSENLQQSNPPLDAAFTVTVDGSPVTVSVDNLIPGFPTLVPLAVSPDIRRGQTVVVSYTDPSAGDDANAIQDALGNDTATFTTGSGGVPPVTNASAVAIDPPGATTGLSATADGPSIVRLSWTAPADSAVSGYRIEVSTDGGASWTDLVANTESAATSYSHTGLSPETTRHYRVSALNAAGAGARSNTDSAITTRAGFALLDFGTSASHTVQVRESGESFHRFTISLRKNRFLPPDNGLSYSVTIPLVVTHLNGATEADYTPAIPASVTFAVGQSVAGFSIRAIPDRETEPGEGLRIDFGQLPAGVHKGSSGPYETVEFVDTEQALPNLATLTGATLELVYDEILDSASTPAPFNYTVRAAGADVPVDLVRVSGSTVTLTLAAAVEAGQLVTLGYHSPGRNPVQHEDGTAVGSFSDWPVTNATSGGGGGGKNFGSGETGAPSISGKAQVGQTLTAVTTGIVDDNGLTDVSYTYQWVRVDCGSETDISGATASSYTPVAEDEGKTIRVKVSFTDDGDNPETLTSAATPAVEAGGGPAASPPGAPESLLATAGDGSVVFEWTAPADDGSSPVTGCEYRYAVGDRTPDDTPWQSAGLSLARTVTGLSNGQTYRVRGAGGERGRRRRIGDADGDAVDHARRAAEPERDTGARADDTELGSPVERWRFGDRPLRVRDRRQRDLDRRGSRFCGNGHRSEQRPGVRVRDTGAEPRGSGSGERRHGAADPAAGGAHRGHRDGGRSPCRGPAPQWRSGLRGPRLHSRDRQRRGRRIRRGGRSARRRPRPPAA